MEINLTRANLKKARLESVNLHKASLREADLQDAAIDVADLGFADLTGANLTRTSFGCSDLSSAKFQGARLRRTVLCEAVLAVVDFSDASIESVQLGWTVFADTYLASLCSANAEHVGPSYIDWMSIAKSVREPKLKEFLLRAGVPTLAVEYIFDCAFALGTNLFDLMQTTFLCYGGPDQEFARKLYEALQRNGVRVFFFAEHAVPGKKLHRTMRQGVNEHDRVILICSKASLDRPGVLNEIEETLQRESRDGGAEYLIPIRIDDYLFSDWKPRDPGVAQTIKDRVVADFSGTDTDDAKFRVQLMRLLDALKKKRPVLTATAAAGAKTPAPKIATRKTSARKQP